MENKIDKAIEYYAFKSKEILDFINSNDNLTVEKIIECGEELSILEYKITGLEVAKEN
jgi:hypothetical protein